MRAIIVEPTSNVRTYIKKSLQNIYEFDEIIELERGVDLLRRVNRESDTETIAFVSWKLNDMSGGAVAELLSDFKSNCSLVFLIRDEKSAMEALELNNTSILRMPFAADKVRSCIEKVVSQAKVSVMRPKIRINTFGNFDIYVNEKAVIFSNSRAKELLAMLINSRGGVLTMGSIIEMFWPDEVVTPQHKTIYRKALYALRNTLNEHGIDDIIMSSRNQKAIRPEGIDCDYFNFLNGDREAIAAYDGDYMMEYSWGELTNGKLWRMKKNYGEIDRRMAAGG